MRYSRRIGTLASWTVIWQNIQVVNENSIFNRRVIEFLTLNLTESHFFVRNYEKLEGPTERVDGGFGGVRF